MNFELCGIAKKYARGRGGGGVTEDIQLFPRKKKRNIEKAHSLSKEWPLFKYL